MKIHLTISVLMVFCLTILICPSLLAADYFISPSGSDIIGNGSIGNPWKTITFAIDNVFPGDVLYLRTGEYHEQLVSVRSGTASAYITISTYNNEDAFIDGNGVTSGNNGCLISHSYLKFRGFTIRNWRDDGLSISNCQFIELKKIKVTAVTGGISLKNNVNDFVLDSCIMYDYYGGAGGYGFDATPEGVNDRIYHGVIKNCKAYLTAGAYDNCDGFALGHDGVSNIYFYNCDVSGVGDGFDISGSGIVLERCSAHNSSYGGGYKLWRDDVVLINCIGYNNSTNVELDFDGSTNKGVHARLVNCTFFACWTANIWIENTTGGSKLELYNCILAGGDNTGLTFDGDNIKCYTGDYNLFHMNTPERTIATGQLDLSSTQIQNGEWTTFSGQDAHSKVEMNAYFLFKDTSAVTPNLHLRSSAMAINNGLIVPNAPTSDFDSSPRSDGKIDIGAYEYSSSTDNITQSSSAERNIFLEQNYPNPFSRMTTIDLTSPRRVFDPTLSYQERVPEGRVRYVLKIYDLLGREVLDVSDRVIHNSSFIIRNTDLPTTGIYFYRLTVDNQTRSRMMVYAR